MIFQIVALLLIHAVGSALGDLWSQYGCYKLSDVKSLFGSGTTYAWQTSSYCETQCGTDVIGLVNGNYCYCGTDTVPSSDLEADMSNCDVACYGYGTQVCGGDGYMLIYTDSSDQILTDADSSSSSSTSKSSSTSTSKSSSTKTSSSTEASSSTSSSASSSSDSETSATSSTESDSSLSQVTVVSTVTSSPSTTSSAAHSSSSTSSSDSEPTSSSSASSGSLSSTSKSSSSSSKSLSGGAIAGVVIGAIAGVLLILGLIFLFLWYRRRRNEEDDDDMFTLSGGDGIVGAKGSGGGNGMHRSGTNSMQQIYDINNNPFLSKSGSKRVNTGNIPEAAAQGGIMTNGIRNDSNHQHNQLNSFSSHDHDEEYFLFDRPKVDITGEANKVSSEYGRRRLSNGSLPDMATRHPGSLQVVNN